MLFLKIKYIPHLSREGIQSERFLDKISAFCDHAVADDCVVGVAGGVKHFHRRVDRCETFGQLPSAHFRHNYIGHQQIDITLKFVRDQEGVISILRLQNSITANFKDLPREIAYNLFVLDDR